MSERLPFVRRNADAEAYGRPAVMPPHPADVAGDRFERDYVVQGRARRVPWAHLAQQLQKPETVLRARWAEVCV